jgi:hypothetical protein
LLLHNGADGFDYACANNDIEIVKALFEHGAQLCGRSILRKLPNKNYAELFLFLLEHGLNALEYVPRFSKKLIKLIHQRFYSICEIQKAIKMTLFPEDTPIVAQIITEFVAGLNNLQRYIPDSPQ